MHIWRREGSSLIRKNTLEAQRRMQVRYRYQTTPMTLAPARDHKHYRLEGKKKKDCASRRSARIPTSTATKYPNGVLPKCDRIEDSDEKRMDVRRSSIIRSDSAETECASASCSKYAGVARVSRHDGITLLDRFFAICERTPLSRKRGVMQ